MGVLDGQAVDAAVTNPAFINKNIDDVMPNKLGFSRSGSGPSIADIQQAVNNLYTATGVSETQTGTNYNATPNTINNGDSYLVALTTLADKFDPVTGHTHSGMAGDAPAISAGEIASVPLVAYLSLFGPVSCTGSSIDVTSTFSAFSPSTSYLVAGVPVTSPFNLVYLASTDGQVPLDSSSNKVYGRLTAASGDWTLSFYSNMMGTETPYTFSSPVAASGFYQFLANPLSGVPGQSQVLIALAVNAGQSSGGGGGSAGLAYSFLGYGPGTTFNVPFVAPTGSAVFVDGILLVPAQRTITPSGTGSLVTLSASAAAGQDIQILASSSVTGSSSAAITAFGTYAAPISIDPTIGILATSATDQVWWVTPSAGGPGKVPITANPQIAAGTQVGQRLTVFGVTNGASGSLGIANGDGTLQNGDYNMVSGQALVYNWNGTVWQFVTNAI